MGRVLLRWIFIALAVAILCAVVLNMVEDPKHKFHARLVRGCSARAASTLQRADLDPFHRNVLLAAAAVHRHGIRGLSGRRAPVRGLDFPVCAVGARVTAAGELARRMFANSNRGSRDAGSPSTCVFPSHALQDIAESKKELFAKGVIDKLN